MIGFGIARLLSRAESCGTTVACRKSLTRFTLLLTAASGLFGAPIHAAILVDSSGKTGTTTYGATSYGYGNFWLSRFTLTTAAHLNGFDVLADPNSAYVGEAVTVRLRNDISGTPAATDRLLFQSTVAAIAPLLDPPFVLKDVAVRFSGFDIGPGSYWFGVGGTNDDLSTILYAGAPAIPGLFRINLDYGVEYATDFSAYGYRLPYRVIGEVAAIPEPASWALLIAGFGLTGAALRRRSILMKAI